MNYLKQWRRNLAGLLVPEYAEAIKRVRAQFGELDFVCRDRGGRVLWAEMGVGNKLFNEGELLAVRTIWRGEAVLPAAFRGRLYNDTPADADALSDLTGEPVGNGYPVGGIAWTRNTTDFAVAAIVSGEARTVGLEKSYTASGGSIGPVTVFVFATTVDDTGVPFAFFTLSEPRTIPDGDSLDITPTGVARGVIS